MDGYSLMIKNADEALKSGKSIEEYFADIISSANKEFEYRVDFSFIYDVMNELNIFRINSYDYSDDAELEEAFANTIQDFRIDSAIINNFRLLARYDKLIQVNGEAICIKLDMLLNRLSEYKEAIKKHKKLSLLLPLHGGIATYANSNISECINPRIASHDEVLYLNGNDMSTVASKNLLTEFRDDAYSMDFALASLQYVDRKYINFDLVDENKLNIVTQYRRFLNASTPLKTEDFFKSAQITLLSLYKKNNWTDALINLKMKLSQAKVMQSINTIIEYCLDMPKSCIYNGCFTKPVQIKSYFFDMPIYEYRTKENVKLHPLFENEQEFKTISRIIS